MSTRSEGARLLGLVKHRNQNNNSIDDGTLLLERRTPGPGLDQVGLPSKIVINRESHVDVESLVSLRSIIK